ncbi:permease [Lacrimispora brassicae]
MKKIIKQYWFLLVVLTTNILALLFYPAIGINSLLFTCKNFLNFLFMLTPVFVCIGLLDVWVEREGMIRIMGEKSGIKGILVAFGLGIVTAVPLYALLPVAGMMLKKGSKISNVLIFICSCASIRIPLLLFEVSSMGWLFTLVRLVANIFVVLAIASIIEKTLNDEEKKSIYENADKL